MSDSPSSSSSPHIVLGRKLLATTHLNGQPPSSSPALHGNHSPPRVSTSMLKSKESASTSSSPPAPTNSLAYLVKLRIQTTNSKQADTILSSFGQETGAAPIPSLAQPNELSSAKEMRFWGGVRPSSSSSALRPTALFKQDQWPSSAIDSNHLWMGYDLHPETREKLELAWKSAKDEATSSRDHRSISVQRASSASPALGTGRRIQPSSTARSSATNSSDDNISEGESSNRKPAVTSQPAARRVRVATSSSSCQSQSGRPPLPPMAKSSSSPNSSSLFISKTQSQRDQGKSKSSNSLLSRSSSTPHVPTSRSLHPAVINEPGLTSSKSTSRIYKSSEEVNVGTVGSMPVDAKGRFYPYVTPPAFPGSCPTISFAGPAEEKHMSGILPLERVPMTVRFAGIANHPVKQSFREAGFRVTKSTKFNVNWGEFDQFSSYLL